VISDSITISPSLISHNLSAPSQPPSSLYEQSLKRSMSTTSTTTPFAIPPLHLGRPVMTPPPLSPHSQNSPTEVSSPTKQTPLQRHLAHLARHGINGVSSAPGDTGGGGDSPSAESPHHSFVNVGNGIHNVSGAQMSGASLTTSNMGSIGSLGSLKGRFSRFGSLNFGRRGGGGTN
jgi:dedicator of cytokinesis protein 3